MATRSRTASKVPSRTASVSKELSAVLGDSSVAGVALANASTRTVASDAVSVAALLDAYLDENGHLVPAPVIDETMFADLPVDERRRRVNRARVLDTLRAGAWAQTTLAAYGAHVRAWRDWCDREGVAALPLDPYLVAQHLTEYALTFDDAGELVTDSYGAPIPRVSVSSVSGRLAALNKLAEFVGLAKPGDFPGVAETMRGIRRLLLVAKKHQKAALDSDGIRRCLAAAGGAEFNAVRLRSLILLRARTSISLVAASRLRWVDVAFTDEGVEVSVAEHVQLVRHHRKEELCLACTLLDFYDLSDTAANVFVKRGGDALSRQGLYLAVGGATEAVGGWKELPNCDDRALGRLLRSQAGTAPLVTARDRALLFVGFYTALRRSNLAALRWDDLTDQGDDGIAVRVRRSKTDQEGVGRTLWIPQAEPENSACPATAVRAYRVRLEQLLGRPVADDEPVFSVVLKSGMPSCRDERLVGLGGEALNVVVQELTTRAGIATRRPTGRHPFGAHSLRAGFVTEGLRDDKLSVAEVAEVTGHKSIDVLVSYRREVNSSKRNASRKLLGMLSG